MPPATTALTTRVDYTHNPGVGYTQQFSDKVAVFEPLVSLGAFVHWNVVANERGVEGSYIAEIRVASYCMTDYPGDPAGSPARLKALASALKHNSLFHIYYLGHRNRMISLQRLFDRIARQFTKEHGEVIDLGSGALLVDTVENTVDWWTALKTVIEKARAAGNPYTKIIFRSGGTIPVPKWFTDWCKRNSVDIEVMSDADFCTIALQAKNKKVVQHPKSSRRNTLKQIPITDLRELTAGSHVLFVIPCCAKKNHVNQPLIPGQQLINHLPPLEQGLLLEGRCEAIQHVNIPPQVNPDGIDFGAAANPAHNIYLQAFDRYRGHLYSDVPGIHDLLQDNAAKITIMSALYGLVSPSDNIQNYNLRMQNTRAIWANVLPSIIEGYANAVNIDIIVGLFGITTAYNAVFTRLGRIHNPHRPVFGVHTISDNHGQNWVSEGLGHALLYLATGLQIPNEFNYTITQVRP